MRLRTKYIVFVSILHILTLVLSYLIFQENKLFFIVSEVFIIISAVVAWQLYLQLIKPLQMLMRGTDAIRDRDFNVKFLLTGKYEMDQLIRVYNDMMDHLREERTRQEEQHFFLEKLIQTSPTGILVLDFDERVYQVNPTALLILGMGEKEVVGKDILVVEHALAREMSKLATGESAVVSMNGIETYKLQKSHFVDRGFVRYFVMMEEVTAEILSAEKRAYGKVIRMMAHEVNNTIGPVNSIMESVLAALESVLAALGSGGRPEGEKGGEPEGRFQREAGDAMENALRVAIQRNTNLNHFMRNFADVVRLPAPVCKPVDIGTLVLDVVALMRVRTGEKRVKFLFEGEWGDAIGTGEDDLNEGSHGRDAGKWVIQADLQQLEQVLINIVKNAMEAIGEEGTVTFVLTPSRQRLVIRDTGIGIAPGSEEQLFSPFFSTKRTGQGIGLTLIREVLINHGFLFSLKTVGGVTEFAIRFG